MRSSRDELERGLLPPGPQPRRTDRTRRACHGGRSRLRRSELTLSASSSSQPQPDPRTPAPASPSPRRTRPALPARPPNRCRGARCGIGAGLPSIRGAEATAPRSVLPAPRSAAWLLTWAPSYGRPRSSTPPFQGGHDHSASAESAPGTADVAWRLNGRGLTRTPAGQRGAGMPRPACTPRAQREQEFFGTTSGRHWALEASRGRPPKYFTVLRTDAGLAIRSRPIPRWPARARVSPRPFTR